LSKALPSVVDGLFVGLTRALVVAGAEGVRLRAADGVRT
jgi:hypothetical protein